MEDIIVYVIIAVVVIVNIVRNYKKEQVKNKKRIFTQQPNPTRTNSTSQDSAPYIPFSRNSDKPVSMIQELEDVNHSDAQSIIDYPTLENEYLKEKGSLYSETIINELEDETLSEESIAFNPDKKDTSIDLNLNSQEDLKKAFIYSLVFERKY